MKQCQVQQSPVWGEDLGTYLLLNLLLHPHCPDQGFTHPQLREGTQPSLAISKQFITIPASVGCNKFTTVLFQSPFSCSQAQRKRLYRNMIISITNKNRHPHCCHCNHHNLWGKKKKANHQVKTLTHLSHFIFTILSKHNCYPITQMKIVVQR